MKPKYLALLESACGCWATFLSLLTSPLLGRSILPDNKLVQLFGQSHPDVKNAIALILFIREPVSLPKHIVEWGQNSWNRGVKLYANLFSKNSGSQSFYRNVCWEIQKVFLDSKTKKEDRLLQEKLELLAITPDPDFVACLDIRLVLEGFHPCFHPKPEKRRRRKK